MMRSRNSPIKTDRGSGIDAYVAEETRNVLRQKTMTGHTKGLQMSQSEEYFEIGYWANDGFARA
jgi:hypothetical protein